MIDYGAIARRLLSEAETISPVDLLNAIRNIPKEDIDNTKTLIARMIRNHMGDESDEELWQMVEAAEMASIVSFYGEPASIPNEQKAQLFGDFDSISQGMQMHADTFGGVGYTIMTVPYCSLVARCIILYEALMFTDEMEGGEFNG
jgi:hypothetical protein